MEAIYRLTKRTVEDYGSSKRITHNLSRIPDGTRWDRLPQAITVGDWLSSAALGDTFTVSITPTDGDN